MLKMFLASMLVLAQGVNLQATQAASEKVAYTPTPKITQPLPFKAGETLLYDVGFSKVIFSGTIGELRMTVSKAASVGNTDLLEIKADVTSRGFFPKLFGIKIKDQFNSVVSSADLGLHASTKTLEEGKVRRELKSVIDREAGRVTFTDRNLADLKAEPNVKQAPSPSWIHDMLSACYFVRTQRLNEGDVIPIQISDGGEVYNIEVVADKREEIKVDAGKFKAIKLNAKIFDGRYIRRSGEMFVWMSDDARRLPVRAKIKTSGATITVDLQKVS